MTNLNCRARRFVYAPWHSQGLLKLNDLPDMYYTFYEAARAIDAFVLDNEKHFFFDNFNHFDCEREPDLQPDRERDCEWVLARYGSELSPFFPVDYVDYVDYVDNEDNEDFEDHVDQNYVNVNCVDAGVHSQVKLELEESRITPLWVARFNSYDAYCRCSRYSSGFLGVKKLEIAWRS